MELGTDWFDFHLLTATALALPTLLFPDASDGFLNRVVQLVGGHVGKSIAHLADGSIK